MSTQVMQEIPKELTEFIMIDIAMEKPEIQTEALSSRADINSAYNRDLISEIPVTNIGVSPRGALARTNLAISRNPDFSQKTMWAPSRAS
jgi:hypothetical protein